MLFLFLNTYFVCHDVKQCTTLRWREALGSKVYNGFLYCQSTTPNAVDYFYIYMAVGQHQWDPILGVFGAPPILERILVSIGSDIRWGTIWVLTTIAIYFLKSLADSLLTVGGGYWLHLFLHDPGGLHLLDAKSSARSQWFRRFENGSGSKIGTPNGTIVSGNMDQSLRSGGLILTHTQLFEPASSFFKFRCLKGRQV